MLDIEHVRSEIEAGVPELDVSSLRFFAEGWDYELWEAGGDLLFRFPKREECVAPLAVEARLLAGLSGRLPLAVPRPEHVTGGFFSYRKLPGVPLTRSDLNATSAAGASSAIGAFLTALHAVPVDLAHDAGVTVYTTETWRDHYREFRDRCNLLVSPLLTAPERTAVDEFWNSFVEDDRHFAFTPALVHRDLGLEHILVDRDGAPSGVIDFADAAVGDPAIDFVALPQEDLRRPTLAAYEGPVDGTFLDRVTAYWQIGPFHEVLYGIEIEDRTFVASGLEGVRERVVRKKHN